MNPTLHISRAFVEFGPFTPDEMRAFLERGILKNSDYVRVGTSEVWLHVDEWAAGEPKPAAAAKKATAKKAAPAKKAAKK